MPMLNNCAAVAALALSACSTTQSFEVERASVAPGTAITWLGEPTKLGPATSLKVGGTLAPVTLTDLKMKPFQLAPTGKVRLISVLPSLDTPVCDIQTHRLGEGLDLDPRVERVTISMDLPYAQRRFSEESGVANVTFLSDYRDGAFGKATGLVLERNGLLARALLVVDGDGIVRHLQVVPEILRLPDLASATARANELVKTSH